MATNFVDDEFVNAALVSEPSADERRRQANRQKFEAASIAEEVVRKESVERARRFRRRRKAKQIGVTGSILCGVVLFMMFTPEGSGGFDILSGQWTSQDLPSRSEESKREPIGKPTQIPALDDRYVYIGMQPDGKKPVAYDPCRPIHYVTNTRTMPPDGLDLVSKAIAEASRATRLVFIDDRPTARKTRS